MIAGGILKVCKLVNTAEKGHKPVYELQEKDRYFYSKKSLSVNRSHFARQDGITVDNAVRCHNVLSDQFEVNEYVILDDANNTQMQITDVNDYPDLNVTDLTLKKVNDFYDVIS